MESWKLQGNCVSYVAWLEFEFGNRHQAFELLDDILYSQRYGGAKLLCHDCPIRNQCLQEADGEGWWAMPPSDRRRIRSIAA